MELCRTCLKSQNIDNLISLSNKYDSNSTIMEVILKFTGVQITMNDRYSQLICKKCFKILKTIVNFIEMCIRSDEDLRKTEYLIKCEELASPEDALSDNNLELQRLTIMTKTNSSVKCKPDSKDVRNELENATDFDEIEAQNHDYSLDDQDSLDNYAASENSHSESSDKITSPTDKNVQCCGCESTFITNKLLREHAKVHVNDSIKNAEKPYQCEICCRHYRSKASLKRHKSESSTGRKQLYIKRKEMNLLNNKSGLEKTTEKRCCGCVAKFENMDLLMRHSKEVHESYRSLHSINKNPFECDICFKVFSTAVLLEQHKLIPYKLLKFSCNKCGKQFLLQRTLKAHEKCHNGKSVKCSECSKVLGSKESLKAHMKLHGPQNYVCQHCGKSYAIKALYISHMTSHSDEKPYSCAICYKKFKQKPQVMVHMRVHTGEKPYSCTYCDKTFSHFSDHKRHEMGHTGKFPYSCRACHKKFSRKTHWAKHQASHLSR